MGQMKMTRDRQIQLAQLVMGLESGSQTKAKMKCTHESQREKKVVFVWHLAPCVIVDFAVSLIVGELECSSVTGLQCTFMDVVHRLLGKCHKH